MDDYYFWIGIVGLFWVALVIVLFGYGLYKWSTKRPEGRIYDITNKVHLIKDHKDKDT